MKAKYLLIAVLSIALFSCEKEKDKDPVVETIIAESVAAYTCYVKATVAEKGSFEILDHGFVYSTSSSGFGIESGTKISLKNQTFEADTFATTFSFGGGYYSSSTTYYVRAYIINTKGTVYGSPLSFKPLILSVGSVQPTSGKVGDKISILGANFSKKPEENIVKFNNTIAKVLEATSTKLVVEIPSGITTYYYDNYVTLSVSVGSQTLNSTNFILMPTLTGFSPTSGTFGTNIIISGENLNQYGLTVKCNNITAGINSSSSSKSMSITVPSNITVSKFSIKVIKNGIETLLPGEFTMNPMTITSVSPAKGLAGSSITVNGTNFNTGYGSNTVKIGGVSVYPSYFYQTNFSFTVPTTLAEGSHSLEVNNGVSTIVLPNAYSVVVPKVTSFSPTSGYYGTEVTVKGVNLFGNPYVTFGNSSSQTISRDSTTIKVTVPSISSGVTKLKVLSASYNLIYEGDFTVLPPEITSFSPTSGTPGTQVSIKGKGFSDSYYGNSVKFGTTSTNIVSITPTEIKALVPSNAGDGAMKITVTTVGQTVVSATDFTITK